MKTKLIQLTTDANVGGGPRYIEGLLKDLPKEEFEPYLIAPKGWLYSELKNQIAVFELSDADNLSGKAAQLRAILIKIKNNDYPFSPMILHAETPQAAYLASKAIRGLGISFVYSEHLWTSEYHLNNSVREFIQLMGLKQALRSAVKVIAVSETVAKFMGKRIVAKEKIVIIYPLVSEIGKIKIKRFKKQSSIPISETLKLGSIGALNPVKGYSYLLQAIAQLKQKQPNIKLEIIGDGVELESLKSQVLSLKLSQVVKIITNAKSLDEYYNNWDIYLQPSLSETFGLAVFEAMRRGIPVIASKVGGLGEIIEDGKSGLLVPAANPDKIESALEELYSNQKLQIRLSQQGLKRTEAEEFDAQKNVDKIYQIYRELTNASKAT